jgi:hypothetical protein
VHCPASQHFHIKRLLKLRTIWVWAFQRVPEHRWPPSFLTHRFFVRRFVSRHKRWTGLRRLELWAWSHGLKVKIQVTRCCLAALLVLLSLLFMDFVNSSTHIQCVHKFPPGGTDSYLYVPQLCNSMQYFRLDVSPTTPQYLATWRCSPSLESTSTDVTGHDISGKIDRQRRPAPVASSFPGRNISGPFM